MKKLERLFPETKDIDSVLDIKFNGFLRNIDSNIEEYKKTKAISDIEEEFELLFKNLKLTIEFDKEYEAKEVLEPESEPYSHHRIRVFEIRDYRFKITGSEEMFFVYSGGGIPAGNAPMGYIKKYLYVRVINGQELSNKEKKQAIFDDLERQKKVLNNCILEQGKKIDEFINRKKQIIENKFKNIIAKNNEKEDFKKSLKNKLSEL